MRLIKFSKSKEGFTLMELLVVVSIIGVLSSIAVISARQYREKAYVAAGMVIVKNIVTDVEGYLADGNFTPGLSATLKNHNGVLTETGDYETLMPNMRVGKQTIAHVLTSACPKTTQHAYWLHAAHYQSKTMIRYWQGCDEKGYFYTNPKNSGSYW